MEDRLNMVERLGVTSMTEVSDLWQLMMEEISGECSSEARDAFLINYAATSSQPSIINLGIREGDKLCGVILGNLGQDENTLKTTGFCGSLYIREHCRAKGYDKLLVEAFESACREKGAHKLYFETPVALRNYWSRAGYKEARIVFEGEL